MTRAFGHATMLPMVCARIAAMVFALCACTALAQQHAEGTLAVDVTDTSGARIPGALIEATAEGSGARFDAATDATGEAFCIWTKESTG